MRYSLMTADSRQQYPLNRFEYLKNEDFFREQVKETNQPFLPTFLPGIRRRLDRVRGQNGDWHIEEQDGNLQPVENKHQVLRHVLQQALAHLHAEEATSDRMPLFPLVLYELLADATGLPVPHYLKENEKRILAEVAANKIAADALKQNRAIERIARTEEKRIFADELQRNCQERDINICLQEVLLGGGFRRDIVSKTFDKILSVPSVSEDPKILDGVRSQMATTHDLQQVSARSHNFSYQDNQCYTRASWLSIFAQTTPEALLEHVCAIGDTAVDAVILEAIAKIYHQDPVAFMQRIALGDREGDEAMPWQENLKRSCHLGPAISIKELLGDQFDQVVLSNSVEDQAEDFLKNLQLRITAAFRPKAPSRLMSDLQTLYFNDGKATSDVPIFLHRALGVPVLLAEISTGPRNNGERASRTLSLRATAPKETELAQRLEQFSDQDLSQSEINALLEEFKDIPVLWLEMEHYSLYLPKRMTQGAREELTHPVAATPEDTPTRLQRLRKFFSSP